MVMSRRSFNLTTLFLGKFRLTKRLTSTHAVHILPLKTLLGGERRRNDRRKYFHDQFPRAWIILATPESTIGLATHCATGPSAQCTAVHIPVDLLTNF